LEYIALFFTTSAAIKFRRKLQKLNNPVEAMPVPRKLSSSCGIAVRFSWPEDLAPLLDEGVEKVYSLNNSDYFLLYEAD
jgi:hypothetical protein